MDKSKNNTPADLKEDDLRKVALKPEEPNEDALPNSVSRRSFLFQAGIAGLGHSDPRTTLNHYTRTLGRKSFKWSMTSQTGF
jgi:hypothetical protein